MEVRNCTGIPEPTTPTFKLYPNPVTSAINIEWFSQQPAELRLYDLPGKLALSAAIHPGAQQLDVSALSQGIYIYTLADASGRMVSGKLVVGE